MRAAPSLMATASELGGGAPAAAVARKAWTAMPIVIAAPVAMRFATPRPMPAPMPAALATCLKRPPAGSDRDCGLSTSSAITVSCSGARIFGGSAL